MQLVSHLTEINGTIRFEVLRDLEHLVKILDMIADQMKQQSESQVDFLCAVLEALYFITKRSETSTSTHEMEEEKFQLLISVLQKLLLIQCDSKDKGRQLTSKVVNVLANMPNAGCSQLHIHNYGDRDVIQRDKIGVIGVLLQFLKDRLDNNVMRTD